MAEKWLGIVVSGRKMDAVHLELDDAEILCVVNQFTWELQSGNEPAAYFSIYERVKDYIKNYSVTNVALKASALGQNTKLSHLKSAELRGVIAAASIAGGAETNLIQKSSVSRTFGERKADEYVRDDSFWRSQFPEHLTKGRREAALLVLSQRS